MYALNSFLIELNVNLGGLEGSFGVDYDLLQLNELHLEVSLDSFSYISFVLDV